MTYNSAGNFTQRHLGSNRIVGQEAHEEYLARAREFWSADEQTSKYGRVDTESRTEAEYIRRADADFEAVFSGVEIVPNWTILEIGCGIGRLLTRVLCSARGTKVIGVDFSERMIQHAKNALGDNNDLMLAVNSGTDLPMVRDGSIDFAYSKDVFIHIHDIAVVKNYFAEVRRVLKPNGIFRFNVRRIDLGNMFSNSAGGLLGKCAYLTGVWSATRENKKKAAPGFDGLQYLERDIHRLARNVHMSATTEISGGQLWCTCRPMKSARWFRALAGSRLNDAADVVTSGFAIGKR